MKKIWMGFAAAAVMLTGVELSAQSSKSVSLGIAAGAAIPVSDFSDAYSTGYNGTVALGLSSVGSPLGLRFEGAYNKFIGRNDIGLNQPDSRIIAGTANLIYSLPGVGIRPYLIGGGGYYSLKVDRPNAQSVNKFGINGGIGAMFPLSGFNTYLEARVHDVFTDVSSTIFVPVTFGILF
jgi:Outer membrane protein beta-barrel domain